MARKRNNYYLYLVCLFLFIGPLLYAEKELYKINEEVVNFRAGPGTEHKVLGSLKQGDTVALIEKSGSWLKVIGRSGAMKGVEGFVHQNVVVAADAVVQKEGTPKKKQAAIPKGQIMQAEPQRSEVGSGDEKLMQDIQHKMLADSLLFLGLAQADGAQAGRGEEGR